MARRRRYSRKRGKKSKPSIALLPVLPVVAVAVGEFQKKGFSEATLQGMMYYMTGYNTADKSWSFDRMKGFAAGQIVGIVAHKVLNKTGVNAHIRRLTMGYISL